MTNAQGQGKWKYSECKCIVEATNNTAVMTAQTQGALLHER